MKKTSRLSKGFTLIELLVVIMIIAILAALIVPRIINRGDEAKITAAKADISTLRGLIQTYKLDTGSYPTSEEGLQALRTAPSGVTNWKGPYADKDIPLDPWQHEYVYQYPGPDGDNSFTLKSLGHDGQEGGEGDNADIGEGTSQ